LGKFKIGGESPFKNALKSFNKRIDVEKEITLKKSKKHFTLYKDGALSNKTFSKRDIPLRQLTQTPKERNRRRNIHLQTVKVLPTTGNGSTGFH
jgi:hypothetical protein